MDEYDMDDNDNDVVRCPRCGAIAEDSMFFSDDDVDQEQPYCECGYEWPVAVDISLVCDVELYGHCDRCDHPCPAYFEIDWDLDDEPTDDELPPLDLTPIIPPYE